MHPVGGEDVRIKHLTLPGLAAALALAATGCNGGDDAERVREEQAELAEERRQAERDVAEERRETREELREDVRELHERIRALPPEERQRLHEELHRDMHGEVHGDMPHRPGMGPPADTAHRPAAPDQRPRHGPGMMRQPPPPDTTPTTR